MPESDSFDLTKVPTVRLQSLTETNIPRNHGPVPGPVGAVPRIAAEQRPVPAGSELTAALENHTHAPPVWLAHAVGRRHDCRRAAAWSTRSGGPRPATGGGPVVTAVLRRSDAGHLYVDRAVAQIRRAAPATGGRAVRWLAAHVFIGLAPLALCFTQLMPSRGFLINLSVALGFLALSVLGLQFALAARFARATAPFGIDVVLRFHRQISFLAVLAAFGHPALLFVESARYRALLDVVHDPLRAKLAWLAVTALTVLMATSIWRRALRISYEAWHVLHSALGVLIVLAALGHAFLVNYYFSEPLVRVVWAVYGAAFLWLAVWVRLVKPLRLWRRPWRVVHVRAQPGGSVTVGLEPAHRHGGHLLRFRAGQFAWIITGRTPFTLTYHPFSMSSSALR